MLLDGIYYGKTPIACVYKGGEIIWSAGIDKYFGPSAVDIRSNIFAYVTQGVRAMFPDIFIEIGLHIDVNASSSDSKPANFDTRVCLVRTVDVNTDDAKSQNINLDIVVHDNLSLIAAGAQHHIIHSNLLNGTHVAGQVSGSASHNIDHGISICDTVDGHASDAVASMIYEHVNCGTHVDAYASDAAAYNAGMEMSIRYIADGHVPDSASGMMCGQIDGRMYINSCATDVQNFIIDANAGDSHHSYYGAPDSIACGINERVVSKPLVCALVQQPAAVGVNSHIIDELDVNVCHSAVGDVGSDIMTEVQYDADLNDVFAVGISNDGTIITGQYVSSINSEESAETVAQEDIALNQAVALYNQNVSSINSDAKINCDIGADMYSADIETIGISQHVLDDNYTDIHATHAHGATANGNVASNQFSDITRSTSQNICGQAYIMSTDGVIVQLQDTEVLCVDVDMASQNSVDYRETIAYPVHADQCIFSDNDTEAQILPHNILVADGRVVHSDDAVVDTVHSVESLLDKRMECLEDASIVTTDSAPTNLTQQVCSVSDINVLQPLSNLIDVASDISHGTLLDLKNVPTHSMPSITQIESCIDNIANMLSSGTLGIDTNVSLQNSVDAQVSSHSLVDVNSHITSKNNTAVAHSLTENMRTHDASIDSQSNLLASVLQPIPIDYDTIAFTSEAEAAVCADITSAIATNASDICFVDGPNINMSTSEQVVGVDVDMVDGRYTHMVDGDVVLVKSVECSMDSLQDTLLNVDLTEPIDVAQNMYTSAQTYGQNNMVVVALLDNQMQSCQTLHIGHLDNLCIAAEQDIWSDEDLVVQMGDGYTVCVDQSILGDTYSSAHGIDSNAALLCLDASSGSVSYIMNLDAREATQDVVACIIIDAELLDSLSNSMWMHNNASSQQHASTSVSLSGNLIAEPDVAFNNKLKMLVDDIRPLHVDSDLRHVICSSVVAGLAQAIQNSYKTTINNGVHIEVDDACSRMAASVTDCTVHTSSALDVGCISQVDMHYDLSVLNHAGLDVARYDDNIRLSAIAADNNKSLIDVPDSCLVADANNHMSTECTTSCMATLTTSLWKYPKYRGHDLLIRQAYPDSTNLVEDGNLRIY